MSPDWADKPEAVPYSSLDNPQSLNLYGYVGNNPLGKADADGHCWPACVEQVLTELSETPAGQAVDNAIGAAAGAVTGFLVSHARDIATSYSDAVAQGGGATTAVYVGPIFNQNGSASAASQTPAPSASPSGETNSPTGPNGPYKRPNNATTKEQRDSVQGKPCATCGATGQKNNADHKDPLVEQHYRGGIKPDKSPNAVRPQCPTCSAQQGAYLRQFSSAMKKLFGF